MEPWNKALKIPGNAGHDHYTTSHHITLGNLTFSQIVWLLGVMKSINPLIKQYGHDHGPDQLTFCKKLIVRASAGYLVMGTAEIN
eukprot:1158786-Pelagomonas_calceolata.AAC.1